MTIECLYNCGNLVSKVCGTDGVTYQNFCQLNKKACETGGLVRFQHYGECSPGYAKLLVGDTITILDDKTTESVANKKLFNLLSYR
jgi:hypothetical protein